MGTELSRRYVHWLAGGAVGLILGFFIYDNAREVEALKSQLRQVRSQLVRIEQLRARSARAPGPWRTGGALPPASGTTSNHTQRPLGLTDQDLATARAFKQRKDQGGYVLLYESPPDRTRAQVAAQGVAALIASKNAERLSQTFAQLGVSPEVIQQFQFHQRKVTEAALECQNAATQLQLARDDYDKRVRSVLSESDYAKYRAYEASTAAGREYERIEAFALKQGQVLDGNYRAAILALIQQANGYTEEYYLGPYDAMPQSFVGSERQRAMAQQEADWASRAAAEVSRGAAQVSLPEAYRNVLEAYYADRYTDRQNLAKWHSDPANFEALKEQAYQREVEDLKQKLGSPAAGAEKPPP